MCPHHKLRHGGGHGAQRDWIYIYIYIYDIYSMSIQYVYIYIIENVETRNLLQEINLERTDAIVCPYGYSEETEFSLTNFDEGFKVLEIGLNDL